MRGKPPKWMVKIREKPIKMDDLGIPLFSETPISIACLRKFFTSWPFLWKLGTRQQSSWKRQALQRWYIFIRQDLIGEVSTESTCCCCCQLLNCFKFLMWSKFVRIEGVTRHIKTLLLFELLTWCVSFFSNCFVRSSLPQMWKWFTSYLPWLALFPLLVDGHIQKKRTQYN